MSLEVSIMKREFAWAVAVVLAVGVWEARAGVMEYGTENVLNSGVTYGSDPKAGATLQGLAANVITDAAFTLGHPYPFSLAAGDFAGTDTIYVGSNQSGAHDGYSTQANRVAGPQVVNLDYSSLVLSGQKITTLTLGIAADDF